MCGFVGIRDTRVGRPGVALLNAALRAISHRGPDDAATLVIDEFAVAHTRLTVIDLTDAARQPMVDPTGRFVLLFNGEIYNYKELADTHLDDDPRLNRASDTAVLLAMYSRFGRDCLKHLNGMFAFAVIDLQTKSVFLARDRFGEKPLYWVATSHCTAFSSEISALRKLMPDGAWDVDSTALRFYHTVGSIPAPYTIFGAVHAVRPGHWIEISNCARVKEGMYWSIGDLRNADACDREEAVIGCRRLLQEAVKSRLISDVPVGIFLSGGLDSGSIVSLIASLGGSRPEALCIDFPDARFSEYQLASRTANSFGMRLHRSLVTPEEFAAHLDGFFRVADQPTTDGFNTYVVARHAKALGIKVWLSGVGGDELFGGYPSFSRIGRLSALSSMLQMTLPEKLTRQTTAWYPLHIRWSRAMHLGRPGDARKRAYQCLRNTFPVAMVDRFVAEKRRVNEHTALACLDSVYPSAGRQLDRYQCASVMESCVYMASQLLRDIDNFSMAHSIEVRAPFLDHRLFEYVYSLPRRFKERKGRTKSLLVDSLPLPLPVDVMSQPKRGFTFPIEVWLKESLRGSFEECVLDERNREFWDLAAVSRAWRAYLAGKVHWSVLWQFYAFARWAEHQHV